MESKGKVYLFASLFGAVAALIVVFISGFAFHNKPSSQENRDYIKHINENYRIYSLPLPEQADFCGEKMPLEITDVAERLDRELLVNSYWHSNTLLSIKRSRRWFPVIEEILKSNNVPDDFKYLSLIESGFTNAISPSGAVGFWQFLPETAKQYGLEVNEEVDERYHVEKSTIAACAYLKDAYAKFGSWTSVAASYNMGMGGVAKQQNRQGESNYYDLLLNEETSRYLFRIVALKEIINNADKYGFVVRPSDLYEPYVFKLEKIDGPVEDFGIYAKEHGMNYKEFKILNPWLRESFLKNKNKNAYYVKVKE